MLAQPYCLLWDFIQATCLFRASVSSSSDEEISNQPQCIVSHRYTFAEYPLMVGDCAGCVVINQTGSVSVLSGA